MHGRGTTMSMETGFGVAGNNVLSGAASAEQQRSLRDQVEAEKRAKTEEFLQPYRAKRQEMQAKRDEVARALEGVDRDLAELDSVIAQVVASAGLRPVTKRKKKAVSKKDDKPPVSEDWVLQKLREQPRTPAELMALAKAEGFKDSSARVTAAELHKANLLRLNGAEQYEVGLSLPLA